MREALARIVVTLLIVVSTVSAAYADACIGNFTISGPNGNGIIHLEASMSGGCNRDADFTLNGGGWAPFGANPSWGTGVVNKADIDVYCDTPGTYTAVMIPRCTEFNSSGTSCNQGMPSSNVTQTYTVPPRHPTVSLTLDKPHSRVRVDYNYGRSPHSLLLNIDNHGFSDIGAFADCGLPQGTCYFSIDLTCHGPDHPSKHTYEAAINECNEDPYVHSKILKVETCPDPTNCKPKEDTDQSCPDCVSKCPGSPVNVGSGDVSLTVPLFAIAQSPLPLTFDLSYHSLAPFYSAAVTTPMSSGWTHSFSSTLRVADPVNAPDRLMLLTPHGMRYYFDSAGSGIWLAATPQSSRDRVLLVNTEYVISKIDGSEVHYDSTTGNWTKTRDRWGNSITGTYTNGLLTTITDSESRAIDLSYTAGQLTSVALPNGGTWTFSYTNGNLSTIIDPVTAAPWRTFEYASDSHGVPRLLTAMRDAAGALLEGHTYDSSDRGITSVSAGGRDSYTFAYDTPAVDQVTVTEAVTATTNRTFTYSLAFNGGDFFVTDLDGTCSTCGATSDHQSYTYDSVGQVLTHTYSTGLPNSTTTSYVYDGLGNVTSKTEATGTPLERTTFYEYADAQWPTFVTLVSEPSATGGSKTTSFAWNSTETVLTKTETGKLSPTGPTISLVTSSTFDSSHRLLDVDGPRTDVSDVVAYSYYSDTDANVMLRGRLHAITDACGHVTTFSDYDAFGTPRTVIDANGVVTLRETDARGRSTSVTNKAVPSDPNETNDYQSTSTFDARDRLIESISPRGVRTRYAYEDGTSRLTDATRADVNGMEHERRHIGYDLKGEKILEQDQACSTPAATCGAWTTTREETYKYDASGRLVEVDHGGAKVAYAYDPDGLLTSVQDENHNAPNTTYAYDSLHRLTIVTQALAGAPNGVINTSYAYDVQNNLTSVTDPNGNVTSYAYDDFGRMQSQSSPVTGTTTYAYDAAGDLTATTDANGATTTRTYDALNRVTTATSSRTDRDTETVTLTYDDTTAAHYGIGRLASMTDPAVGTTYAYERRGLLRAFTHADGTSVSFGFDGDGNRTSMVYPSGRTVSYTYDYASRPYSVASGSGSIITSATYLPFGPATQLIFGNGTMKTAAFDDRYRWLRNKLIGPLGTIADYQYSEDASGNITQMHDAVDASYNRDFGYDDLNRLVTANSGASLWGAGSYTYDRMGNMTSLHLGLQNESFSYVGSTPRLTTVPYDAAGNETLMNETSPQWTYSARNLLAHLWNGAMAGESQSVDYAYDGRGIRVAATWDNANGFPRFRQYWYSPELHLIAQSDWAAFVLDGFFVGTDYVWFGDVPVAQLPANNGDTARFTFTDHLGTPILQTDSSASVVWRADYEPYGKVYTYRDGDASMDPQTLRFPGQEESGETQDISPELTYNIFRWYRSGWGRYTQSDPMLPFARAYLVSDSSLRRDLPSALGYFTEYGYVGDRPIGLDDPYGLGKIPGFGNYDVDESCSAKQCAKFYPLDEDVPKTGPNTPLGPPLAAGQSMKVDAVYWKNTILKVPDSCNVKLVCTSGGPVMKLTCIPFFPKPVKFVKGTPPPPPAEWPPFK
jgi:RHS repeat-associated protein